MITSVPSMLTHYHHTASNTRVQSNAQGQPRVAESRRGRRVTAPRQMSETQFKSSGASQPPVMLLLQQQQYYSGQYQSGQYESGQWPAPQQYTTFNNNFQSFQQQINPVKQTYQSSRWKNPSHFNSLDEAQEGSRQQSSAQQQPPQTQPPQQRHQRRMGRRNPDAQGSPLFERGNFTFGADKDAQWRARGSTEKLNRSLSSSQQYEAPVPIVSAYECFPSIQPGGMNGGYLNSNPSLLYNQGQNLYSRQGSMNGVSLYESNARGSLPYMYSYFQQMVGPHNSFTDVTQRNSMLVPYRPPSSNNYGDEFISASSQSSSRLSSLNASFTANMVCSSLNVGAGSAARLSRNVSSSNYMLERKHTFTASRWRPYMPLKEDKVRSSEGEGNGSKSSSNGRTSRNNPKRGHVSRQKSELPVAEVWLEEEGSPYVSNAGGKATRIMNVGSVPLSAPLSDGITHTLPQPATAPCTPQRSATADGITAEKTAVNPKQKFARGGTNGDFVKYHQNTTSSDQRIDVARTQQARPSLPPLEVPIVPKVTKVALPPPRRVRSLVLLNPETDIRYVPSPRWELLEDYREGYHSAAPPSHSPSPQKESHGTGGDRHHNKRGHERKSKGSNGQYEPRSYIQTENHKGGRGAPASAPNRVTDNAPVSRSRNNSPSGSPHVGGRNAKY